MDWKGRRVVVTGGAGFLGSHIVERLAERGARVAVPRKKEFDLTDPVACERLLAAERPEVLIHGAAYYGGIGINQQHPGRIYWENTVMGANIMEAARRSGVEKFVTVGTACAYPGRVEGRLGEEQFWDGPLHESVEAYGLTKKILQIQGRAYHREFGFGSIHLILTNLYGPRDSYNPGRSHVVAALVRKFVEAADAGAPFVEVWGSGAPVREFLFVEDAAEAVLQAAERYEDPHLPLNIGTGVGTSIRELAETLKEVTPFEGELRWDPSKPDGAPYKVLDTTRMKEVLAWEPPHDLRSGLRKTVAWYRANKEEADSRF
jgi:GDP-L-fucose synthase